MLRGNMNLVVWRSGKVASVSFMVDNWCGVILPLGCDDVAGTV